MPDRPPRQGRLSEWAKTSAAEAVEEEQKEAGEAVPEGGPEP